MRQLLLLAAVVTFLGLAGAPAHAERAVRTDPAGDVWHLDQGSDPVPAPRVRTGDVRRATLTHGPQRFVLRIRFARLARTGQYAQYALRLQNGAGTTREVFLEAAPRRWAGRTRVFDGQMNEVEGCDVTHRIAYARNVMRISVARSCLGDPHRVRMTTLNVWADNGDRLLTDNPHNTKAEPRGWTRWLRRG